MNAMNAIVWILPIIFMLHDFEEIIMVGSWKMRHEKLLERLVKEKGKDIMSTKAPYKDFRSTASFSVAVLIIFFCFSFISLLSCFFNSYFVWYGVCFAFVIHCVLHFKMCLQLKYYVPGVATAAVFLPVGIYLLWYTAATLGYTLLAIVFSILIGSFAVIVTFIVLHGCIARFEMWLNEYAVQKNG